MCEELLIVETTPTPTPTPTNVPTLNKAPIAINDTVSTKFNTAIQISILANDYDSDGSIVVNQTIITTNPSHGAVSLSTAGVASYTPTLGFFGNDSFIYRICDDDGACSIATAYVKVNKPPIAINDNVDVNYQIAKDINVSTNDTDSDGSLNLNSVSITTQPLYGTAVTRGSGVVTYNPNNSYHGLDTFSYRICDDMGDCSNIALVTITVNEPPIATDDSESTPYETPVLANVTDNDYDNDGTIDITTVTVTLDPLNGSTSVNILGQITYTPDSEFFGEDYFNYRVCDNDGDCDYATVTVSVEEPPNNPPVTNDDYVDAPINVTTEIDVLSNDTDTDGTIDSSSLTITVQPSPGSAVVNTGSGTISYTPDSTYIGPDSLMYEICDDDTDCTEGFVMITVDIAYDFTLTAGGSSTEVAYDVETNSLGQSVVVGTFQGTNVNFGDGDTKSSAGDSDIFISKNNPGGSHDSTMTIGGSLADNVYAVAIDSSDNLIITGDFSSTGVDFDTTTGSDIRNALGYADAYVTKYNSDGSYAWTRIVATSLSNESAFDVDTDSDGNVYYVGHFRRTNVDFDGTSGTDLKSAVNWNGFVSKYNSDGSYGWTRTWGGDGDDSAYAVSVGATGVYVSGRFQGDVDFDDTGGTDIHSSTSGTWDIFITKYNLDGSYAWTKTFGGTGEDYGNGLAVDASDNVFVSGYFQNSVNFDADGNDTHTSNGSDDRFLTKYSSDGYYEWTRTVGGPGDDENYGAAKDIAGNMYVDQDGSVFFTGHFIDADVDFDGSAGTDLHSSNGSYDIFVTKYENDGSYGWTKTFGGSELDEGNGVCVDNQGAVYIAGKYQDTVNFDATDGIDLQTSFGIEDLFITKYIYESQI